MVKLFAYTDGAGSGNPGPGGWGAILIARDGDTVVKERELNGGAAQTTNNTMPHSVPINNGGQGSSINHMKYDSAECVKFVRQ